jgi:hypothetical protein
MGYYSRVKGKIDITRLSTPELPEEIRTELDKRGLIITSQHKGLSPEAVAQLESIEQLHGYVWVSNHALTGVDDQNKVYELDLGIQRALEIIENDGCCASDSLQFLVRKKETSGDWSYEVQKPLKSTLRFYGLMVQRLKRERKNLFCLYPRLRSSNLQSWW